MITELPWSIVSIYFFTQMIINKPTSYILITWRFFRNKISRSFDKSFLNIRCLNAIIELDTRLHLNFRCRYAAKTFTCPHSNFVEFFKIKGFATTITLYYSQCHYIFQTLFCILVFIQLISKGIFQ